MILGVGDSKTFGVGAERGNAEKGGAQIGLVLEAGVFEATVQDQVEQRAGREAGVGALGDVVLGVVALELVYFAAQVVFLVGGFWDEGLEKKRVFRESRWYNRLLRVSVSRGFWLGKKTGVEKRKVFARRTVFD